MCRSAFDGIEEGNLGLVWSNIMHSEPYFLVDKALPIVEHPALSMIAPHTVAAFAFYMHGMSAYGLHRLCSRQGSKDITKLEDCEIRTCYGWPL